jgi:hypothetical protein
MLTNYIFYKITNLLINKFTDKQVLKVRFNYITIYIGKVIYIYIYIAQIYNYILLLVKHFYLFFHCLRLFGK